MDRRGKVEQRIKMILRIFKYLGGRNVYGDHTQVLAKYHVRERVAGHYRPLEIDLMELLRSLVGHPWFWLAAITIGFVTHMGAKVHPVYTAPHITDRIKHSFVDYMEVCFGIQTPGYTPLVGNNDDLTEYV